MRFETAVIQEASYFLLITKYYQDGHIEQENGTERNTRKRKWTCIRNFSRKTPYLERLNQDKTWG